jgi:hypothetical protein
MGKHPRKKKGIDKKAVTLAMDCKWNEEGKTARYARKAVKKKKEESEEKYAKRNREI